MNRSFRTPRLWSNSVLAKIGPVFKGSVINVSGWDDRDKAGSQYREYFVNADSYFISNTTGKRGLADAANVTDFEIDLEKPLDESLLERFDVVLNHTTLEHIFDVTTAFRNLCRLSRDVVIVVVPFAQALHFTTSYGDYWRLTPMSLRRLFEDSGFDVVLESANSDRNAGVYLLVVGSRHPARWTDKMPNWQPIEELGGWIGVTLIRRLRRFLASLLRRA